jgi:hypothetical protein
MGPCQFMTDKGKYDIGKAYQTADLVVVGAIKHWDQRAALMKGEINAERIIKGDSSKSKIKLVDCHITGTAVIGLCGIPNGKYLFLLKSLPQGVYDRVDHNGGCPNIFEVKNNVVEFGSQKISLSKLNAYLEKNPAPI